MEEDKRQNHLATPEEAEALRQWAREEAAKGKPHDLTSEHHLEFPVAACTIPEDSDNEICCSLVPRGYIYRNGKRQRRAKFKTEVHHVCFAAVVQTHPNDAG